MPCGGLGNDGAHHAHVATETPPNQPHNTQEALLSIQSDRYKAEYAYRAWLSRCCVVNGNPHYAWELYLQVRPSLRPLGGGG